MLSKLSIKSVMIMLWYDLICLMRQISFRILRFTILHCIPALTDLISSEFIRIFSIKSSFISDSALIEGSCEGFSITLSILSNLAKARVWSSIVLLLMPLDLKLVLFSFDECFFCPLTLGILFWESTSVSAGYLTQLVFFFKMLKSILSESIVSLPNIMLWLLLWISDSLWFLFSIFWSVLGVYRMSNWVKFKMVYTILIIKFILKCMKIIKRNLLRNYPEHARSGLFHA